MRKFSKHKVGIEGCPGCEERLEDAHPTLKQWFNEMKSKNHTLHCSWVFRDEASQNAAFANGDSKLNWPRSKHNKLPAEAIDVFQIRPDGRAAFDPIFCATLNAVSIKRGYKLRWGGSFKSLGDSGHFELIAEPNEKS
jgi:hypothetical protein